MGSVKQLRITMMVRKKKTKRSVQWVREKKKICAGLHLIAEFWGGKIIDDLKETKRILGLAAKKAGNTPLKAILYKFSPQGMTGVLLLAESHIALHSWPEFNYLAIDIFTCGDKAKPYKALEYLKKVFKPKRVETKEIRRGIMR